MPVLKGSGWGKGRPGVARGEGIGECHSVSNLDLGCISLRKYKIGFLNPKESENGFCVSLLNRSIQDISDYGVSKEPKNPHGSFDPHDPKYLGLICLVKKCKIRFWIPSDFTIQSWIFIKKRTLAEKKKRKKSRTNEAKAKETRRRQEREREEQFQLILDNYYIICHNLKSPHYLNTNIPVPPQGSRWRTI